MLLCPYIGGHGRPVRQADVLSVAVMLTNKNVVRASSSSQSASVRQEDVVRGQGEGGLHWE